MTDIDIDFADRNKILSIVKHIPASMIKNEMLVKHPSGVYFHDIPIEKETNIASIPYIEASDRGYFKIDFLNLSIYEKVKNEDHLNMLLNKEPYWELLENEEFVNLVMHLHGHYHDVLKHHPPKNVKQLAMVLALRLPAKKYLIGKSWDVIENEIWKPTEGYWFKKAHAIAYATAIVVQMNLLVEELMENH